MESKNSETILNILDETGCQFCTEDRTKFEQLRNRIRVLESENIELKRIQQHLYGTLGRDCTNEFAKLINELQDAQTNCEDCRNVNRQLRRDYTEAMHQIDQQSMKLGEIERKALDLEEENSRLRELIRDLQSTNHHLQLQSASGQLRKSQPFNEFHPALHDVNATATTKSKSDCIRDSFVSLTLVLAIFTLIFVVFVHICIYIQNQH